MNTPHLSPDKLLLDVEVQTDISEHDADGLRVIWVPSYASIKSWSDVILRKMLRQIRSKVGFVKKTQRRPDRPACVESGYYLQESLTIFTFVMVKCPCSLFFSVAPLSFAISCVSSFMLCNLAFDTTPVAVTVWPT
jgi:hypothetical protein